VRPRLLSSLRLPAVVVSHRPGQMVQLVRWRRAQPARDLSCASLVLPHPSKLSSQFRRSAGSTGVAQIADGAADLDPPVFLGRSRFRPKLHLGAARVAAAVGRFRHAGPANVTAASPPYAVKHPSQHGSPAALGGVSALCVPSHLRSYIQVNETIAHLNDDEGNPEARPFTRQELQRFLDDADGQVGRAVAAERKGALAAYRDATLFKSYRLVVERPERLSLGFSWRGWTFSTA
jgi:hypothetical protein